ncbi:MAG: glycosyltransferase family 2 protein [Chthoniobacter sp.]
MLAKEIPGLDIEVIVVESNSTDGTREIALRHQSHPRVKLVLEDKPGQRSRRGAPASRKRPAISFLIQDADLEYDLEDYDALLEPLMTGREAFVLGSRHSGSVWKMRQFSGQAGLSAFLNFGHWFFTTLVNVLFGQRLKDPFTMFKVFRRDSLFGLKFECDRFDFDFELLVKLIRKGYRPVELPVNYRSRSQGRQEGVDVPRSDLLVQGLLKLRLAKIDPLGEVEHSRPAAVNENRRPAPWSPVEKKLSVFDHGCCGVAPWRTRSMRVYYQHAGSLPLVAPGFRSWRAAGSASFSSR